jgi:hypothetical protein
MPPMSRITAHHKKNANKYSARKKADILWNSARNNSLGSKHKVFISPDADDPPVAYVSIDQMYQKFMVVPTTGTGLKLIIADLFNLIAANLFPPRR